MRKVGMGVTPVKNTDQQLELLQSENAALKDENAALKDENERLKAVPNKEK